MLRSGGWLYLAALFPLTVLWGQDSHSSGWIVIPTNDYTALRARAFPTEPEAAPARIEKTLTRVEYDLKVVGELASGHANLTVDVLKEGWVRVPIPVGLLVRQARLDGKPLSLIPSGSGASGQLSAVLSRPGRAVLALDVVLPVSAASGEEKLVLPSSSSGITSAAVTLPRQGMELTVLGGVLADKSESAEGARWVAYGRANESLTFAWRRKMEEHRAIEPLRFRGSLTELVGLGEDATSVYAEVDAEVLQGSAAQLRIQIPQQVFYDVHGAAPPHRIDSPMVAINQVLGAAVGDWEVKDGVLTVRFLEPVEKTARFLIAGESRLPREGAVEIPLLRLLDAERESGGAAVEVQGAGEIKDAKSRGLESADASELGPLVSTRQSPSLAAFRFLPGAPAGDRTLNVQVARYKQQAVLTANIEEARYRVLMTKDGKTLLEARYAVRNSQRDFLKVALPSGAVVWSAALAGRPVRPAKAPDGNLLLPLMKTQAGEEATPFPVTLVYLVRGPAFADRGRATFALPALDLPVSKSGVVLYAPPGFRLTAEPGSFRMQAYEKPASAAFGVASSSSAAATPASANATLQNAPAQQADILQQFNSNAAQSASQALVDKYKAKSEARTGAKALPAGLSFPVLGASIFLASELTGENRSTQIELSYQNEKKGGVK
jgi:microcystin-dependent protein